MYRAFEASFKSLFRHGRLTIEMPGGGKIALGDGAGPDVAIVIRDRRALWRLLANLPLAFGELYMDGRIEIVRGTLYDLCALASRAFLESGRLDRTRLMDNARLLLSRFGHVASLARAQSNVAHHYDLDAGLYRLFLDRDLQYSCGYYEHDGASLDEAQLAKKRHIAAKLMVEPGQRVLDIGCGWGGLGLYLARHAGADVTGVTLSKEQRAVAEARARDEGLAAGARFELQDYRATRGRFDRIVSVGMLEHVGRNGYATFFRRVADLLDDDGVALIHNIGRTLGPAPTNAWMKKYIFPGGYIPALSELMPAVEAAGLFVTDLETLRLHYARTIRAWRENFAAHRAEVRALTDERFCRMWDLYLCGAECGFRIEGLVIFQMQLAKRVDAVPLTRGYMAEREEELKAVDTQEPRRVA